MRNAPTVLKSSRLRPYARLTVRCGGPAVAVELVTGGEVLWSGVWETEVRRGGLAVPPMAAWEAVCRHSDRDVDYLELALDLAGGLRIERHLLLARKDRFLLLADAVLGSRPARLQYFGRLPLGPAVRLRGAKDTWAASLFHGARRLATVVPLALPACCGNHHCGELFKDAGPAGKPAVCLALRQAAYGRGLFAPLWFDLDRRRPRRLVWRPLSVGQAMQVQPADAAVGFRVAAGTRQWLLYRSLAEPGNRTLLGHNLTGETLVARFLPDGRVQPLIEIESGPISGGQTFLSARTTAGRNACPPQK
jgi:hypothetical protein